MVSRRSFVSLLGSGTTGALLASACNQLPVTTAPLDTFFTRMASGELFNPGAGFGRLIPRFPENKKALPLRFSRPLLAIPRGFQYTAISIAGERMSDGSRVPSAHDGMACFAGPNQTYLLVRNHEIGTRDLFTVQGNAPQFDPRAGGGTTTLVIGQDGLLEQDFASLAGTFRNCAGGSLSTRGWLTCEETIDTPQTLPQLSEKHGYVFEVPAAVGQLSDAKPLRSLGRFRHEAVALDPETGYVYLSEDNGVGCFYRFRPTVAGDLSQGILEALRLSGSSQSVDTGINFLDQKGISLPVDWVPISDPDPDQDTVALQGQAQNASIFRRGEGVWYSATDRLIYFVSTSGGNLGLGQIWAYSPDTSTVTLVVESTSASELDNPDNITVGLDGTLYLCEDGEGVDYVVGVSQGGEIFKVVRNLLDDREFAGVCFSPDGKKLFVNGQGSGITFCLWRQDDRPIVL